MDEEYGDADLQRLYDKKYFSGRSRSLMWERRAEFIVEKFNPKTCLDVGCAYGELVKALVDLGVDAYGIDGSDFVLTQVDDSIKDNPEQLERIKHIVNDWADMKIKSFRDRRSWVRNPDDD